MAANISPIFTLTGNMIGATAAAANTASDGSGTLVTLVTAGVNGTRVDGVKVTNCQVTAAASSAMVVRVFLSNASNTNITLIAESALAAATRSTTAIGTTATITFSNPIIMLSGQKMYVAQSVYAGVQDMNAYIAFGGDY